MKTRYPAFAAAAFLLLAAIPAFAQDGQPPSPIARGDITASLGWFNANKEDISTDRYNDWYSRSLYGGVAAGWYWTDHLKTEIDVGATTKARLNAYRTSFANGRQTSTSSEYSFSTRKLAIGQQYQFFRNVHFHPHVAAGVDVTWDRVTEEGHATMVYDPVTRTSTRVIEPFKRGPETDVVVRPFAAVGFKAYMTPRSFFRSDVRTTFRGGIDEVLWRFGFGVDF